MTRLVEQPIQPPVLDAQKAPRHFRWAGQSYRVTAVLDCWRDVGAWWEAEPEKTFWRVETQEGGILELWQDAAGRWAVYRVWD